MYKAIRFTIKGVVPTIMHNGQTSDPLNRYAKEMKKLTSKKIKTDEDHLAVAKVEWFAALYVDDKNRPCWPGENIESMIVAAARKNKLGIQAKSGIIVDGNTPIDYEGPKNAEKLWSYKSFDKNPFISRVPVVVNRSRVMRTRPIFTDWSLTFTVHYLPTMLTEDQVIEFMEIAGTTIGLSDWRPKYGRFHVMAKDILTGSRTREETKQEPVVEEAAVEDPLPQTAELNEVSAEPAAAIR
jgi:hypothetical protein